MVLFLHSGELFMPRLKNAGRKNMTKLYKVTFLPQRMTAMIEEGTTILEAEQAQGLEPDAPCGGMGTCGKCRVTIRKGKKTGSVLACQTSVDSDMVIDTNPQEKVQRILAGGRSREVTVDPGVRAKDDKPFYLMAFDIGTTTLVGYLMDGRNGKVLATESRMNPQHTYGADVISRANYVLENENGSKLMKDLITGALNKLISQACDAIGIDRTEILQVAIVGNTCMHHLFLGLSPKSLVLAPYVPAVKEGIIGKARDYQIQIAPEGRLILLPNIAGFVGGDTVGCMLSIAFDQLNEMSLMIDIGTNGEMVLGDKNRMMTTSTAAGPAFEGAKIECGMRGSRGAVSHLTEAEDELKIEVIDDVKPIGICGSGLIDILAFLIRRGFLDQMGGFVEPDELEDPVARREAWRLITVHKQPAFLLYKAEDTGNHQDIYLSQKDVREVQLAKGAIAAGIQILSEKLGIEPENIEKVYLAGAFGNYMDAESACMIGLIPYALHERIVTVGNAAGEGAKLACLNKDEAVYAGKLAKEAEFIELANEGAFQDVFVDQLQFDQAREDL